MTAPTAELVDGWRQQIVEHPRLWCPTCRRRRCWVQAEARGQLAAWGESIRLESR